MPLLPVDARPSFFPFRFHTPLRLILSVCVCCGVWFVSRECLCECTPAARPLRSVGIDPSSSAFSGGGGGVFFLKDCNCKAGDPQSKWDIPGPSSPLGAFLPGSQFNLQAFLASKGGPKPVKQGWHNRVAFIGRSLGLFDAATFHFFFPLQNAGEMGRAAGSRTPRRRSPSPLARKECLIDERGRLVLCWTVRWPLQLRVGADLLSDAGIEACWPSATATNTDAHGLGPHRAGRSRIELVEIGSRSSGNRDQAQIEFESFGRAVARLLLLCFVFFECV